MDAQPSDKAQTSICILRLLKTLKILDEPESSQWWNNPQQGSTERVFVFTRTVISRFLIYPLGDSSESQPRSRVLRANQSHSQIQVKRELRQEMLKGAMEVQ